MINITQLEANLALERNYEDLKWVKYYLTSPGLAVHADIHYKEELVLRKAIVRNDIKMVDFLLNSSKLKEKAKVNYGSGYFIRLAAKEGYLDIVKMILAQENFDFTKEKKRTLIESSENNQTEVVKFFLNHLDFQEEFQASFAQVVNEFYHNKNYAMLEWLLLSDIKEKYTIFDKDYSFFQFYLSDTDDSEMVGYFTEFVYYHAHYAIPLVKEYIELGRNRFGRQKKPHIFEQYIKSLEMSRDLEEKLPVKEKEKKQKTKKI